jgi:hypothetical protein
MDNVVLQTSSVDDLNWEQPAGNFHDFTAKKVTE